MISVIVPVYNVKEYLPRCVNSILQQTYSDYELILINDGSTDGSGRICDYYKSIDKRIRVIHQENKGLAETRNIGMKKSKGEYITFIDSDDYVLKDYLYTLAELIHKYKADMSIVGVRSFDDNHLLRVRRRTRECCIYGKLATERMLYQKSIDVSANAMLLKRDKALRHLFPSNRFFEDAFVTYKYYYESSRVAYSTKVCYAYYQRPESIMHSKNQEFYDELDASDSIMLFFKNKEIELFDAAVSKAFSNYCQVLLRNPNIKKDFPDAYKRIDRFLRYSRWRIILNRRTRIKNKVAAILTIPGVSFFLSISKKIYIRISG